MLIGYVILYKLLQILQKTNWLDTIQNLLSYTPTCVSTILTDGYHIVGTLLFLLRCIHKVFVHVIFAFMMRYAHHLQYGDDDVGCVTQPILHNSLFVRLAYVFCLTYQPLPSTARDVCFLCLL